MKLTRFLLFLLLVGLVSAAARERAPPCDTAKCKPPYCRCSSISIPGGLGVKKTPQFVLLTFDDAVVERHVMFYREALRNRVNPDGCPVSATFFVSHEYTDYTLVNELYGAGHEIALHSISHKGGMQHASVQELTDEFIGGRRMLEKFAKIPVGHVKGLRMPFLQMAGNNSFQMITENELMYDFSMPTQLYDSPGLWPYTLDYQSTQECTVGPCPTESFPGVWVFPMLSWTSDNGYSCSMVDSCTGVPNTVDELFDFFKKNFEKSYLTNKAPMGFYLHAAWFLRNSKHFEAYKMFLDYLQTLDDVYLVSASTVINWVKQPVQLANMKNSTWSQCRKPNGKKCKSVSCKMCKKEDDDDDGESYVVRYAKFCGSQCPSSYPWVGNFLGEEDYSDFC